MQQIFNRGHLRTKQYTNDALFLHIESAKSIIDRLSFIKRDFKNVLVIGKGTASLIDYLTARGSDIIVATVDHPKAQQIYLDEEWLPFKWPCLDLVVCNLSLHWLNDLPGTLWQIRQSLRPDGLFLGSLFGGETLYELRQCLAQAEQELKGGIHPRVAPFVDLGAASQLLSRAQFNLPVADKEIFTSMYTNVFPLLDDLKAMGETNVMHERCKSLTTKALFEKCNSIYHNAFKDEMSGELPSTFALFYLTGWAQHASQQKPLNPGAAEHSLADAFRVIEQKV
jgi:SAM-dependent methyltransferase